MVKKSVISQLASVGEGALGKIAQNPATRSAFQGAMQLKDRGEKFVHGVESLDDRLAAIEQRLDALEQKPKRTPTRAKTTAAKATAAKTTAGGTRAATEKAEPSS